NFTSSSSTITTAVGDTLNGTFLQDKSGAVDSIDGTINGEFVVNGNISLLSNGTLKGLGFTATPEPGSFTLGLVSCFGLAGLVFARRRRNRVSAIG
ncbi:MAG TPA: hypothetical protein VG274_11350, partial [Rhizomicrobium sp.]|nr:hypothetical protein [Rhizomicrobium sp.]